MISFIRLIDQTTLIADIISEDDETVTLENALILHSEYVHTLEQKYTFKGMYCPFVEEDSIITVIDKINVVSIHTSLDSFIVLQYNNYLRQWFRARSGYKRNEYAKDVKTELEEMLEEMQHSQQSNTVH